MKITTSATLANSPILDIDFYKAGNIFDIRPALKDGDGQRLTDNLYTPSLQGGYLPAPKNLYTSLIK